MADTPITNNPPNPQVESTASKQVSNVSTAALLQSNPALGKEYLDYQKQQQAKLEADAIKAYTATEGEPPDSIELSLIRTEAELQAKNDANAKYKDQIIAAGAGTVTQTGTPPPSNPDPVVSETANPQVPVPPAPAPTAESVVNQSNPAAAQDRYALFVEEQRKLQSSLQEQLARENPTWSPSRVFSTAKLRADTEANAIVDQKLQQQITEASQAPTSVTTDSNPQVPAATPTPPAGRPIQPLGDDGGGYNRMVGDVRVDGAVLDRFDSNGLPVWVKQTPATDVPVAPDTNSQVPASTGKITDFSFSTLATEDPATAKALITDQRAIQQKIADQQIAEYRAATGIAPGTPIPDAEVARITVESDLAAKAQVQAQYKDQIVAAGAGKLVPADTPLPTTAASTNTGSETGGYNRMVGDVRADGAVLEKYDSNGDPVWVTRALATNTAVTDTNQPEVQAQNNSVVADVNQTALSESAPDTAKAYNTTIAQDEAKIKAELTAEAEATWGKGNLTVDQQNEIADEAALTAKANANAQYKDQLQASGAATSVPAGTPPPGPVANTVSATTDPQIPPVQDFGAEPSFVIPPPQDFGTDPQTPQPSTAVAGPPTPAPKPPSPSPYERFIAQEAAATDAAQAEANKRFQAQIDALNDPQAPQAIPVENAANLEAVPLDNNATDYGDFIGGNGIEPQPVDYGQELGNGDPGVSNFYGDPLGDKIAELQTEPAAADPVDYGDFIGGNGADPEPVDYGQELGNGNAESAGFADFFSGADTAIADATARALRSAASISPGTDPLAKDSSSGLPASQIKTPSQLAAERQSALVAQAKAQQQVNAQRKQANDGDWRVKIRLAGGADYLYKVKDANGKPAAGILNPLAVTDGVIFPYTPQITTQYAARYSNYELTHSNYKGYFYQGSNVGEININATFTAQDTDEAEYLLAVIQFFRSVTKMFYGQDDASKRGAPPPLVFLQGLGAYQFNLNPCVVANFNYTLPADVDYIRAYSPNYNGTNLLQRRNQQNLPIGYSNSSNSRLSNSGLNKGGINLPPPPPTLGINSPTYVPTKMDVQLVLLPVQTRSQVSQQFSLKQFANGDLVRGGFW